MPQVSDRAIMLQVKPYRETSAILSLLSEHHGLIRGVLKGQRGPRTSRKGQSSLLSISMSNISFMGRSELKTLTRVEPHRQYNIKPAFLPYSLLVTELCHKLLPQGHEEHILFSLLDESLTALTDANMNADGVAIHFITRFLDNQGYDLLSDDTYGLQDSGVDDRPLEAMPHAQVLQILQKTIERCYPRRSINSFTYITGIRNEARG